MDCLGSTAFLTNVLGSYVSLLEDMFSYGTPGPTTFPGLAEGEHVQIIYINIGVGQ